MNDEERRAAIIKLIERYTEANCTDAATARRALIREGIYTEEGELAPEYGGPARGLSAFCISAPIES